MGATTKPADDRNAPAVEAETIPAPPEFVSLPARPDVRTRLKGFADARGMKLYAVVALAADRLLESEEQEA